MAPLFWEIVPEHAERLKGPKGRPQLRKFIHDLLFDLALQADDDLEKLPKKVVSNLKLTEVVFLRGGSPQRQTHSRT